MANSVGTRPTNSSCDGRQRTSRRCPMRVAIYVRVSTTRQAQQQTIEQQRERLVAHAREQGWSLREEHIFRDDGYSGSVLARPGLDRLRDAARNREIDRVLVTAPD